MKSVISFLRQLFPAIWHDEVFLVGGSVRDYLLERAIRDTDLVVVMPDSVLEKCGFRRVTGKTTAPIWFRYDAVFGIIEVSALDSQELFHDNLLQRDFTANALAMSLSGKFYDPLGGRRDLEQSCLRACSNHSFADDPLRIFRALRFEADGWRMEPDTEALVRSRVWEPELEQIPVERFSREMFKGLAGAEPARFFQRMVELGVGRCYLPELFRMAEIPAGPLQYHPEGDLLTHSLQVLERTAQASGDPHTRFCALFHDIGKLATDPALYPKHHGHDKTGFDMAKDFCNRLKLPSTLRTALAWVSRLHGSANQWDILKNTTKVRIAEQALKAGISRMLPLLASADKPGGAFPEGWDEALRIAAMSTAELGIEPDRLAAMPNTQRRAFIHQKRVETFRALLF